MHFRLACAPFYCAHYTTVLAFREWHGPARLSRRRAGRAAYWSFSGGFQAFLRSVSSAHRTDFPPQVTLA
jgi:hypothetical protein